MSSARKRAAIQKANSEAAHLREQLTLSHHHYTTMKTLAEALAGELTAWRKQFPQHEYRRQDECVVLKLESGNPR